MTIEQFKKACELLSMREVDKVCFLAYFQLKTGSVQEFTAEDGARWLVEVGCAAPNRSRLGQYLRSSHNTVKGRTGWRLAPKFLYELEKEFPALSARPQDVIEDGTILPELDYINTHGYIENLSKQINASFEHNIFDGCAVLMRRLLEVMLILAYRHLGIDDCIQDQSGNFQMLDAVIKDAKSNRTLSLSRNGKASLDTFRELGNFSAHKIEYTCRREYIKPHILEYRALIVELLHKAGLRA